MLRRVILTVNTKARVFSSLMSSASATSSVKHDVANHRFVLHLENGENAVIEYRWIDDSVIDLYHTEVPVSHRGRGLAQLLTKAALDYVVAKDARMVPSCSYVEKFVRDNPLPQYSSRVCK